MAKQLGFFGDKTVREAAQEVPRQAGLFPVQQTLGGRQAPLTTASGPLVLDIQYTETPEERAAREAKERTAPLPELWVCKASGQPLPAAPSRDSWLTFFVEKEQSRIVRQNDRINAWLARNGYEALPFVPCWREQNRQVPGGPGINPGEAPSVVRLWQRYAQLWTAFVERVSLVEIGTLLDRLRGLPNLYMRNYHAVAHAIEWLDDTPSARIGWEGLRERYLLGSGTYYVYTRQDGRVRVNFVPVLVLGKEA